MADQPITSLPVKTSSGMAATDYLLGIDSAEGYRMLIQDLGDYIIQHATSNISGSNQTIANAILGKLDTTATAKKTSSIPFAQVDDTSTATAFTATVDGITELSDGVCVYLKNGVITSAAGFTVNINNLGAKPVYSSMAAATAVTTVFSVNYTMLFIYNSTRVEGGCWDLFYGYYSDQNTIAYQVRANHAVGVLATALYRYQIIFTKKDGTLLPANTTNNSTSTSKTLTADAFDPFAPIYYYSTTTNLEAGATPNASYIWMLFSGLNLRYAFNAGTTLTAYHPVYVKCTPQSDGTVKLSGKTCIVQALPSTADGYVYIMLGIASSTSALILTYTHPVYYYANGSLRLWTNPAEAPAAATAAPLMDGTAAVGSSAKYAKEDHVHPSDTTKQATLVSGTNIKTVNNTSLLGEGNISVQEKLTSGTNIKTVNSTSLLGSGNIAVQPTLVSGTNIKTVNNESILGSGNLTVEGLPAVTSSDNGKILRVVNGVWAADSLISATGVSF